MVNIATRASNVFFSSFFFQLLVLLLLLSLAFLLRFAFFSVQHNIFLVLCLLLLLFLLFLERLFVLKVCLCVCLHILLMETVFRIHLAGKCRREGWKIWFQVIYGLRITRIKHLSPTDNADEDFINFG